MASLPASISSPKTVGSANLCRSIASKIIHRRKSLCLQKDPSRMEEEEEELSEKVMGHRDFPPGFGSSFSLHSPSERLQDRPGVDDGQHDCVRLRNEDDS